VCDIIGCFRGLSYRLADPDPSENWSPGDEITVQLWDDRGKKFVNSAIPDSNYVVEIVPPNANWFVHGRKYKVAAVYPSGNFWPHISGAECVVFDAHYSENYYERVDV
jgi:hypothetical protein